MFDSKHYIPILKWKRAEQGALKVLEKEHKKYITPLIQFVMPRHKADEQFEEVVRGFEDRAGEISEKILDVWGTSPIFIDVSLLYTTELKSKSLRIIIQDGFKRGAHFIPVIYLSDEGKIKQVACFLANKNKSGLCLRLICPDFGNLDELNKKIKNFLISYHLSAEEVDLLVDIKEIGENGTKCNRYLNLMQKIINISKWRSFIFASGAFPKDLTNCKIDEENLIPRLDWRSWISRINGGNLVRKPAFADYTIQHPIYRESTQFYHPTTSMKYTLDNDWLIMKGKKQKFGMYLAHAKLFSDDSRFYGEDFSNGDKYIAEKAQHYDIYIRNKKLGGTGNTETWLKAGINHHLALVAHQIANLP